MRIPLRGHRSSPWPTQLAAPRVAPTTRVKFGRGPGDGWLLVRVLTCYSITVRGAVGRWCVLKSPCRPCRLGLRATFQLVTSGARQGTSSELGPSGAPVLLFDVLTIGLKLPRMCPVRATRAFHTEAREFFPAISGVFTGCRAPQSGRRVRAGRRLQFVPSLPTLPDSPSRYRKTRLASRASRLFVRSLAPARRARRDSLRGERAG